MDDSCAVCADVLEWVAYGACGHRDVCSTCVARLRFICDDRRCCICKTESPVIFVTKALGDYTRMINDFSVLPLEPKEGRVGSYWYHEDTQAFFDDVDHYKMIKAMCRLSCSVCDKAEEEGPPGDGSKRRPARFRNIEQLKGHLFHKHRLIMCSLCLEGRKVFICEQKLYTRAQLNQHISRGDSEVDGSESERGGFAGHPMCEFCKTPFYGDNELYSHMSTEHYTCHICQRQHPGQYEYYKNYDDLEMHFRRDHFLCEDEACLAKKFVVFHSEAEMKRHNTLEHGGRMSRSKRNAALQIPTSFRFRRSSEQDHRRGRGRTFRRDESDSQLSMAIEASLGTARSEALSHDPSSSISGQVISDHRIVDDIDPLIQPFESLTAIGSEASSRYLHALGQNSMNSPLEESFFPPLAIASSNSQQNVMNESLPDNTMAARLRRKNNRKEATLNTVQAWPAAHCGRGSSSTKQAGVSINTSTTSRSSTGGPAPPGFPSLITPSTSQSSIGSPAPPGFPSLVKARATTVNGTLSSALPGNLGNKIRINHSPSAPNLTATGSSQPSISDFPPVSATQLFRKPPDNQVLPVVGDVQTANKYLVEKLRSALEYDNDKYASFKDISAQYRQGLIDTAEYLDYVQQYGLSHLVPELARLCPDAQKQKELIETYHARTRSNGRQQSGFKKGKALSAEAGSSKDKLADNVINTVRTLQSQFKHQEEELEVLSRDGYRATKGELNLIADEQPIESRGQTVSTSTGNRSTQDASVDGSKVKKKTSKFHRVRIGDGSMAALLDLKHLDPEPDPDPMDRKPESTSGPAEGLPVRGVWRKGGVQRLFL